MMYSQITCVLSLKNLFLVKLVCNILQNVFGRPRPCVFSLCKYSQIKHETGWLYGVFGRTATIDKCDADISFIRDAFRSFPSFYAALSVSGATLSLLLLFKFSVLFETSNKYLVKVFCFSLYVFLLLIPMMTSTFLVSSNMNSSSDLIAGYIIGACIAYFTSCQFYTITTTLYTPLKQAISRDNNIRLDKD
ncbi:hypothetical protein WA158_002499 [Blastocystis sp. Blastoise]